MSTLSEIIDSARYDLQDYGEGVMFTDSELVNYMNRMFVIMDSMLAELDSDLVYAQSDGDFTTTSSSDNVDLSTLNSNLWSTIREVWIGTDHLWHVALSRLLYKQKFNSGEEKPYCWALWNRSIYFQADADDDYDLIIEYNSKTGTLAGSADMPYGGAFDEFFRSQLILHSKMKRLSTKDSAGDGYWNAAFKRAAMAEVILRGFVKKPYLIDF